MLTPRLKAICDKVTASKTTCDIGTDHAYVPIDLIENNRAERVIATDLNAGPLRAALSNIKDHSIEDRIELRQGSGLSVISEGEADFIIIAGMGGEIIEQMLRDKRLEDCTFILQPMTSQYELRKYLLNNSYRIEDEDIVTEGFKVYNIIVCRSGEAKPFENEFHYQLPPYLYSHKSFKALYDKKLREFCRITEGIKKSETKDYEKLEKYEYFLKELKKIHMN